MIARSFKNLAAGRWLTRHYFSPEALLQIEEAIHRTEQLHSGQVCFAVEAGLGVAHLRGSSRDRAVQVFSDLRVWDTEQNCGVLLYVLLAEHALEIVADRGLMKHLTQASLDQICQRVEASFHCKRYTQGVLQAIEELSALLVQHFPSNGTSDNELRDAPVVL